MFHTLNSLNKKLRYIQEPQNTKITKENKITVLLQFKFLVCKNIKPVL